MMDLKQIEAAVERAVTIVKRYEETNYIDHNDALRALATYHKYTPELVTRVRELEAENSEVINDAMLLHNKNVDAADEIAQLKAEVQQLEKILKWQ